LEASQRKRAEHLNVQPVDLERKFWRGWQDSNSRPLGSQPNRQSLRPNHSAFQKSYTAEVPFWDYTESVRVIAVSTLRDFWQRYPDAEQPLKAWYEEATTATWTQPADIKAQYRSASVLKNRRVVFNIKGNDYRLIVAVAYKLQVVYVKFVGTHKGYDAVDAETIDMA
jgi:mRNA interferase HigB